MQACLTSDQVHQGNRGHVIANAQYLPFMLRPIIPHLAALAKQLPTENIPQLANNGCHSSPAPNPQQEPSPNDFKLIIVLPQGAAHLDILRETITPQLRRRGICIHVTFDLLTKSGAIPYRSNRHLSCHACCNP
jgi:hypothetical protein